MTPPVKEFGLQLVQACTLQFGIWKFRASEITPDIEASVLRVMNAGRSNVVIYLYIDICMYREQQTLFWVLQVWGGKEPGSKYTDP